MLDVQAHLPQGDAADAARAQTFTELAEGMLGSRILAVATEVRAAVAAGETICNLSIGDFSPRWFRLPPELEARIGEEVAAGNNNYPPADGLLSLRHAICDHYAEEHGVRWPVESVVVGSGARPPIFAAFNLLLDPGDVVLYGLPSWNIEYYVYLNRARGVQIETRPEHGFHLTAAGLAPHLASARLLLMNSPLNPCGTCITEQALRNICEAVLAENRRRETTGDRPLVLVFDQVYRLLTYGDNHHHHPLAVCPELAPYTIYVDAISKCFAGTGLRVGWGLVPPYLQPRFKALMGHMGSWAPRPVQAATAWYLRQPERMRPWLEAFRRDLVERLDTIHGAFARMAAEGLPVEAIAPQGAIYLSVRLDLVGRREPGGRVLETNEDIRRYLLRSAGVAVVPFRAFAMEEDTGWFRTSVGAVGLEELRGAMDRLAEAVRAVC